jgi:hypothetical protein
MAKQLKAEFLRHLEDKGHDDLWSRLKDHDAAHRGMGVHLQRIRLTQPHRVPGVQRGQDANE